MNLELLTLQYNTNDKLAPGWLEREDVNFYSAIRDEAGELAVSAGWKPWWSKAESQLDPENCKTEVVDLLHFHMSAVLKECFQFKEDSLDGLSAAELQNILLKRALADFQEAFVFEPLQERTNVDLVNDYLGDVLSMGAIQSIGSLLVLARRFGMDDAELAMRYIAKNALNNFRKTKNYKGDIEGAPPYVKLWDGENEDNYFVTCIINKAIDNAETLTYDEFYSRIAALYAEKVENANVATA